MLSTEAYWARGRTRAQVEIQTVGAWRVVGVYDEASDAQLGYARAVSDGVRGAYLADVIVDRAHQGQGIGKLIVETMIDDGPGADFRWTLFTRGAHACTPQYGFAALDATVVALAVCTGAPSNAAGLLPAMRAASHWEGPPKLRHHFCLRRRRSRTSIHRRRTVATYRGRRQRNRRLPAFCEPLRRSSVNIIGHPVDELSLGAA